MRRNPLALDTSTEIEERQIEAWRRMTPDEKAAIVTGLTQAVIDLARAGIRQRHPGISERAERRLLAEVMHGPELVQRLYPRDSDPSAP